MRRIKRTAGVFLSGRAYSIRHRMLFFFLLATVALLVTMLVVHTQLETSVLEVNESYYKSLLIQTSETIDSHLENYQTLSRVFAENPALRYYLKQVISSRSMYEVGSQWIKREVLRFPIRKMFCNIYVHIPDMPPVNCYFNKVIVESGDQMLELMDRFSAGELVGSSVCVVTGLSPYQLTLVSPIYDRGKFLAMISFDLQMDFFTRLIAEAAQGENNTLLIVDSRGVIQYSTRPEEIFTDHGGAIPAESYVTQPLASVGWRFIGALPRMRMQAVIFRFFSTFLAMILAIMFVVSAYSLLSFRAMMNPMRRIADRMRQAEEGDLETELPESGVKEYQSIVRTFNSMLKKIKNLMETMYNQQVFLRKAQIGEMQSKFNPHFLYNTLDMIYWHLIQNKDDKTADMVVALSEILRYSISSNHEFNAIWEERQQIENYLLLQSSRMGDDFEWEVNFDEDILQCRIPCLLLQPLVENAFNHAFKDDKPYRYVGVTGQRDGQALILSVVDNGVGMSREAICRVLNDESHADENSTKIGIALVHKRLQYIYGNQYGIQIQSHPGEGCVIHVMLEACEDAGKYMSPGGQRTREGAVKND